MATGFTQDSIHSGPRQLAAFIRIRKEEILAEWQRVVRRRPTARDLDTPTLVDHIPLLLDQIADMADELVSGVPPRLPTDLAQLHALELLEEGFDLEQVIGEFYDETDREPTNA